jgi:hypothetical protein
LPSRTKHIVLRTPAQGIKGFPVATP